MTWLAVVAADAAEAAKVAKHEAIIPLQRTSNREPRERRSRDGGQDTKPGESAMPGQQRSVYSELDFKQCPSQANRPFPSLLQR